MNRILQNANNAQRILQLTADTLILVNQEGVCIDVDSHSDLWFLQEKHLLGKNLRTILPKQTLEDILPAIKQVIDKQKIINQNFKLDLNEDTYYFKCIMQPYDDMVLCQYRDITRRNNIKIQLEKTNRELTEVQKAAFIGQWKYNTEAGILSYRGHTGIFCSQETHQMTLTDYTKLIIEKDRLTFIQWMEKNKSADNTESIDYRILFDNHLFYIRIKSYYREEMPNGSYNIEGYIQNITNLQRHQNDINTLTHAINNAKESIFSAKEDGTMTFANLQFLKNHAIEKDVPISHLKIYEISNDLRTLEKWQERCRQTKLNGTSNFIAHHPTKNDKNILALEGTIYHINDDNGNTIYWSFAHDISERLRHESQIKQLNHIMEATLKNLPASIVVKDINNQFKYIYRNRKLDDKDINVEEAIGKSDFDYHLPEIAAKKRIEDVELSKNGQELHWVIERTDSQGNLSILDKRKLKVESNGFSPVIISIEWDITPLEMMKRALQLEKEKAETSDRLKSAFLANMSHEIRTPLNAIVGFSRIIAESHNADERKNYYEIVDANTERLLQLINEILDLSKIESGVVEFSYAPVKLNKLCLELHDALVFRCPQGVLLVYEPSDESLYIHSDKNRIFQVISNLITNAYKFTPQGRISYGYHKEKDHIVFHVSDTGLGIEAAKLEKVFDRFVMVNNVAQGTGLGLSICKTIIERLGGNIYVESKAGAGTTFSFTLPAIIGNIPLEDESTNILRLTHEALDDANVDNWSESGQMPTLLIAEDIDSNYQLLEAILKEAYYLERARDGMEAVTMFDVIKPDIVLMDIRMPNLNGLEATKIIRELDAKVPIIALSAYAYDHDRQMALDAGCNDFISKPIEQDKLKETIQKRLNRK